MKYLFINSVAGYGSTGRIAAEQCRELSKAGHECVLAFGRLKDDCDDVHTVQIGSKLDYRIHALQSRVLDNSGFGSRMAFRGGNVSVVDNGDGTMTVEIDVTDDRRNRITGTWTGVPEQFVESSVVYNE